MMQDHMEVCPVFTDPGAECTCWNRWFGGAAPVAADEPVTVWWPNEIKRTYERGDHIVWRNLRTDGSVRWRRPV